MKKAIVIGSGISGLAISCYLAQDGYEVKLYEKNRQFGGRASVFSQDGFIFDAGPSWYLMPEIFESFFQHFGKKTSDYYRTQKLDPAYRIYFGEADYVDIGANIEHNKKIFDSIEPGSSEKFLHYIAQARQEYDLAIGTLLKKNYDSLGDIFSSLNWQSLKFIAQRKNLGSYEAYVKKYFSSPKLQKILLYTSVFLGGSPKKTPALYSLINHCDFNDGVYFPEGGIASIIEAFVSLAGDLGVQLYNNTEVKKITIEHGKATGVLLESGKIDADIVISSGDYHYADQYLIDPPYRQYSAKKWESFTLSPSGFILYLGISKKISGLQHHTLVFDADWDAHFDSIFCEKKLSDTPSYYVSCVSKTQTGVAPKDNESVFIFVPTAPGLTLSDEAKEIYAEHIITHLGKTLGEDIYSHVLLKKIYTGDDFSRDYFAFQGNALGLAHTFTQTLSLRPKNKHPKVSGLYFTGHYTTPGTGMPMVLLSAKLVRDKILTLSL